MKKLRAFVAKLPKGIQWGLGILLTLLITARILLPGFVLRYVNHQLSTMQDYEGHVDDIDIALIRGAYVIKDLKLSKRANKIRVPFISFKRADISVQWKALFEGSIVAEIELTKPVLNFVDGPTEETSQKKMDLSWQEVVSNLVPLKINRLSVKDGEIHFRNLHSQPPVDLLLSSVEIEAQNLTNSKNLKDSLPAHVTAHTLAMGEAPFRMKLRMNALKRPMDFDYDAELKDLPLKKLNAFFLHYAYLDVDRGTLHMASELAAKNGKIAGYVKPSLINMKVVKTKHDIKKGPFSLIWQSIAGTIADIFQNKDRQEARIPIEGTLAHPDVDTWDAIKSAFSHAFGKPLTEGWNIRSGPTHRIALNSSARRQKRKNTAISIGLNASGRYCARSLLRDLTYRKLKANANYAITLPIYRVFGASRHVRFLP